MRHLFGHMQTQVREKQSNVADTMGTQGWVATEKIKLYLQMEEDTQLGCLLASQLTDNIFSLRECELCFTGRMLRFLKVWCGSVIFYVSRKTM